MTNFRIGYMPLTDAALLIIARDKGYAAARGLGLELVRENSWANIRDKLALGYFDAAHMLAPAAIATSIDGSHLQTPLVASAALGLNGNALTVSPGFLEELRRLVRGDMADPAATADALARLIAARRAAGAPPPTFGFVFPFSSHYYQLRIWMGAAGIDADRDARLVVLPPPLMTRGLESGYLDGFCVGAPWNSIAVDLGVGAILHLGVDIAPDCPEKLLALRADRARENPESAIALAAAIRDASLWMADPAHLDESATLVARACGEPVTAAITRRVLSGDLAMGGDRPSRFAPDYLRLDPEAITPRASDARWLFEQMLAAGQFADTPANRASALAVYGPDPA